MTVRSDQSGQAAVELVAVLPVLIALLAGVWQVALVGHASWSAAAAARAAAARATALGLDPRRAAARAHLPPSLEHGLRVRESDGGEVTVTVRVPSLLGGVGLGHASARAAFAAQR